MERVLPEANTARFGGALPDLAGAAEQIARALRMLLRAAAG